MNGDGSRRRVLLVSYWVPPRRGIGSVRAGHLLKYLPQYGWNVTALTARLDTVGGRVRCAEYVETKYCDVKHTVKRSLGIGKRRTHDALNLDVPAFGAKRTMLQRFVSGAAAAITYPDEQVGWLPFLSPAIRRLLRTNHFDVILTSGPPVTAHVAAALSRGTVPWIADLRDLWSEDDSRERSWFESLLNDKVERWCLSRAAALTISSGLSGLRFQRRYPGKACYAISTGFDQDEWENVPFGCEGQCTLLYGGTLYHGKRDPSKVFAAVREILDERLADQHELRLDFYTEPESWLCRQIAAFRLQQVVRVMGLVQRRHLLAAERRADRLLLLSWDGPTAEGVVPGKLFEYFGARRRILAVGAPPSSSVEGLLSQTQAGVCVRTVQAAKREILSALEQYRNGKRVELSRSQVDAFTGAACARDFASVLNYALLPADRVCSDRTSANAQMPANTAK